MACLAHPPWARQDGPAVSPELAQKEKAVRQGSDPSGSPFKNTIYSVEFPPIRLGEPSVGPHNVPRNAALLQKVPQTLKKP
jgi:hypothetical protein